VVTSHDLPGAESYASIEAALRASSGPVWFFGGARIYAEAMAYAGRMDLVYVPDHVDDPDAVRFPPIDPKIWQPGPLVPHEDEPALSRREYRRLLWPEASRIERESDETWTR
jgi:dihydrofolate reductase